MGNNYILKFDENEFKDEWEREERKLREGVRYFFKFKNGFGASIIKQEGSYGFKEDLWELAVVKWSYNDWEICYSTEITDDVVGFQTDEEIVALLRRIKSFDKNHTAMQAFERLVPTKPILQYFDNKKRNEYCPRCEVQLLFKVNNYCWNCGQAIDWSEE